MSRERILEVILTVLGALLLLIAAVGKHPYGFYMVLRLVITANPCGNVYTYRVNGHLSPHHRRVHAVLYGLARQRAGEEAIG